MFQNFLIISGLLMASFQISKDAVSFGYAYNFNRILPGGRRQKLADFPQTRWTGSETTKRTFFFSQANFLRHKTHHVNPPLILQQNLGSQFIIWSQHISSPPILSFLQTLKLAMWFHCPFVFQYMVLDGLQRPSPFFHLPCGHIPILPDLTMKRVHDASSTRLQPKLKIASLFCAVTGPWTLFCCCTHYFLLRLSLCLYPLPISYWNDSKKAPYAIRFSILSI